MNTAQKGTPIWANVKGLPHRLIGIAEGMRLYQVTDGDGEAVVMVTVDGPIRRYPMTKELSKAGDGRYLSQGGLVVWNVMNEEDHIHNVHSLDLSSGHFSKTQIPF